MSKQIVVSSSERTKVFNFQNREKDPFIEICDCGIDMSPFEEKKNDLII